MGLVQTIPLGVKNFLFIIVTHDEKVANQTNRLIRLEQSLIVDDKVL